MDGFDDVCDFDDLADGKASSIPRFADPNDVATGVKIERESTGRRRPQGDDDRGVLQAPRRGVRQ